MQRELLLRTGLALALTLPPAAAIARPAPAAPAATAPAAAFPGALGWAASTPGGRGGRIIKVTTLSPTGPGSFTEAVQAKGPRIVVFEVGGVIDLNRQTVKITEPFLTIAGQTAPSPGVTLIRGGLDVGGHDVIIQHIRVRPGEAGAAKASGVDFDSISTVGAYNVIVDHCSLTWGTDENLSASGPRFTGKAPEEWRAGASHRITFSNNLIAESLSYSTHAKVEHSKGSLIHDNTSDILIYGNLYAHNYERNPLFKGGVRGAVVNNLIFNPGQRAVHYNLMANEWGANPPELGRLALVGNVLRGGRDTPEGLPLVTIGGVGDLALFAKDNVAIDRWGRPLPATGRYTAGPARILTAKAAADWPEGLTAMPAAAVEAYVQRNVGARPWDRDHHDVRILADVAEGRGEIIDSEAEVGGYPVEKQTYRAFDPNDWNLDDMTPKTDRALDSSAKSRGT